MSSARRWLNLGLGILSVAALLIGVSVVSSVHILPLPLPNSASGTVQHLQFYSRALQSEMKLDVYLPPGYTSQVHYPVIYLLHGKDGTENSWMSASFLSLSSIDVQADANRLIRAKRLRPVIIVSPEIDNSYGVNTGSRKERVGSYNRGAYETYLIGEVIPYVDRHFSTIPNASARYIGGYSMGGFAALHLAFAYPKLFTKVGTLSAALWQGSLPAELDWIYPTQVDKQLRDPLTFAQSHKVTSSVFMVEGKADPFYRANLALAHSLSAQHVSLQFHIEPGRHDYLFWNRYTDSLLEFFAGTSASQTQK